MVGSKDQFVQLLITEYDMDGKLSIMIQIRNVSANILYDQSKADNKFLQMINACISHELRNPLNSIIAQNMNKEMLYKELENIIGYQGLKECDNTIKKRIKGILKKLKEGNTI